CFPPSCAPRRPGWHLSLPTMAGAGASRLVWRRGSPWRVPCVSSATRARTIGCSLV
ncbi:MAG: hypothetical protein AVDCRST_MAG73-4098, partial [uncultured Thermomicrobiales bacterium]